MIFNSRAGLARVLAVGVLTEGIASLATSIGMQHLVASASARSPRAAIGVPAR